MGNIESKDLFLKSPNCQADFLSEVDDVAIASLLTVCICFIA